MKVKMMNLVNSVDQEEFEAGLLSEQYSVAAKAGKAIDLPDCFYSDIRIQVVRDAVQAARANRRQAYGHNRHVGRRNPQPGMKHSVEWHGKGTGVARIMRKTGQLTGAENPHTRGGRRAHGPKVEKTWTMKVNSKVRKQARNSAIAATINTDTVANRGHCFSDNVKFPIIIDGYAEERDGKKEKYDVESIPLTYSTRKFIAMMEGLGLGADLNRAKDGRNIRAGKGKMRGRRRRTPKSILLVVGQRDGLAKAASNVSGVDVVAAKDLSAEDLAPGGDMGRLTVWTKSAIEALE
jgi:large subunit ribosomal protein L4e